MKFFRIDDLLIRQIEAVLDELKRLNPEYQLVCRALKAELKLLPRDRSVEDLNQDLMSGLLRTFDQMFGSDGAEDDQTADQTDEQTDDLEALLRSCGLRLRDRLN